MSDLVSYEQRDGIAVLTIDNPPVNALAQGVREAIVAGVEKAARDRQIAGIVLTGRGAMFAAGADIKAFDAITTRDASLERSEGAHRLLVALEDSTKPIVAAIRGLALGGGLEFAMACHGRIASPDAKLGQPEVTLGLIPGAGGTQRLPRLVPPETAIAMCVDGKPLSAGDAQAAGLIDRVEQGDLIAAAAHAAQDLAKAGSWRVTRRVALDPGAAAVAQATIASWRVKLQARKDAAAPLRALDALEAAYALSFEEGSRRERELFADRVLSTESRALRHLFFAEREAARPTDLAADVRPLDIRSAAVVGAGTMGAGIAMCYASAGIPVLLNDVSDEALRSAVATIRRNYESSVAKGRITAAQCERALSLISTTATFDGFDWVDIVVEAAFEDMELKRRISGCSVP